MIEDKDITLNDVNVEMIARHFNWPIKVAQAFIDMSIERGMIVPVRNGMYRAVSQKAIQQAKDIIRIREA